MRICEFSKISASPANRSGVIGSTPSSVDSSVVACLRQQEQELELQEAWQVAQMAAAGLASEENYYTEQEAKEQNGYQYLEVKVYATKDGRQLCSLVEALP